MRVDGLTSAPRLPQAVQTKPGNVGQSEIIGPALGVDLDMVAAAVVAANRSAHRERRMRACRRR
jgi:hypothetical protein